MQTQQNQQLQLESLRFSHSNYNDKGDYLPTKQWKAEFQLMGGRDTKAIQMQLSNDIAEKIMRILLPIVSESASRNAQELANAAKEQANTLAESILKQLPAETEV